MVNKSLKKFKPSSIKCTFFPFVSTRSYSTIRMCTFLNSSFPSPFQRSHLFQQASLAGTERASVLSTYAAADVFASQVEEEEKKFFFFSPSLEEEVEALVTARRHNSWPYKN